MANLIPCTNNCGPVSHIAGSRAAQECGQARNTASLNTRSAASLDISGSMMDEALAPDVTPFEEMTVDDRRTIAGTTDDAHVVQQAFDDYDEQVRVAAANSPQSGLAQKRLSRDPTATAKIGIR